MLILGITDGQTCGAALLEDSHVLAAVNEERLVRKKQARGFPRESIREVFRLARVQPSAVEAIAVAQIEMPYLDEIRAWQGWFEERDLNRRRAGNVFFAVASRFGWLIPFVPGIRSLYYALRGPQFRHRRKRIAEVLRGEFRMDAEPCFYHHHLCHAASAYYGSGFDDACVVTMDGGGDQDSSHVYHGRAGKLTKLGSCSSYDSLGNYYAYVTALSGYKAKKHEGKITGLAAHGEPVYRDFLEGMIEFHEGKTRNRGRVLFRAAMEKIRRALGPSWKKEDLACSIQLVTEDVAREYVRYWMGKTRSRDVAVAGGIFANVRVNQEIHELDEVDRIFVFPGMSDEGLAVGAGLAHYGETRAEGAPDPRVEHVYLGPAFQDAEIESALEQADLPVVRSANIERSIAQLLADGYIVARFNGAMEFGPRALGNRSILYNPTDPSVNDWLNNNLHRTEFMPFAPAVLYEQAERCFGEMKGGWHTAQFMTVTYGCTSWMRENCGGVVHIDGTARPQLVRKETNPSFYTVIEEFHRLTGLPCVINTSFNMHEEPIVCTPADAIRAFKLGHLDYLAIGGHLVKSPYELTHEPKPVGARSSAP